MNEASRPGAGARAGSATREFFAACDARFERATGDAPPIVRSLALGGRSIRLEMDSGPVLDALWPPLAHLATGSDAPALRVRAWQGGELAPSLPRDPDAVGPGGVVRSLTGERTWVVVNEAARTLQALDLSAGTAWFRAAAADALPWWDRAAPLRSLLARWVRAVDQQMVHAAAVSWRGAALVLAGRAGAGKSTAALACLADPEFGIIGDDYVLLRSDPLFVEPVYGLAKLDREHLRARLPGLSPLVVNPEGGPGEKCVLAFARMRPDRVTFAAPVAAMAVPVVVGEERSSVRAIPRARVLAELAPTTLFQQAGSDREALARMAGWVRRLPAYELRIGRDLCSVPGAVQSLLRRHQGEAS